MRKLIVFTNISLDGYFEGPGHDISGFKNDFEAFSSEPGQAVDALLFGHKTYDMMKFWSTPQAVERMPEVAGFMNETQKFVASHTDFDPGWQKVTVLSGDIPAQIKALKQGPGQNMMVFGSNELVVSLMQAGLIDELQIVVNPVALVQGTPLFQGLPVKVDFALKGSKAFKSGAVLLWLEQVKR